MTTANFAPSRPGVLAGAEQVAHGLLARLGGALAERRVYRRTLAELSALNMRQREDIGIDGLELRAVARTAAHRN